MSNFFKNLFGKVSLKSKEAKFEEEHDISYGLIRSFGIILILGSILVAFEFYIVPDFLFLVAAILALTLSLVTNLKNGFAKSLLARYILVFVAIAVLILMLFKFNLSALNNGLSLLALSFSFIFLPLKTYEEKQKKLREENNKREMDKKNEIIADFEKENKRLEHLSSRKNVAIREIESKLGGMIENYKESISDLEAQLEMLERKKNIELAQLEQKKIILTSRIDEQKKSFQDRISTYKKQSEEQSKKIVDLTKETLNSKKYIDEVMADFEVMKKVYESQIKKLNDENKEKTNLLNTNRDLRSREDEKNKSIISSYENYSSRVDLKINEHLESIDHLRKELAVTKSESEKMKLAYSAEIEKNDKERKELEKLLMEFSSEPRDENISPWELAKKQLAKGSNKRPIYLDSELKVRYVEDSDSK